MVDQVAARVDQLVAVVEHKVQEIHPQPHLVRVIMVVLMHLAEMVLAWQLVPAVVALGQLGQMQSKVPQEPVV
jgi:hypothetical protein